MRNSVIDKKKIFRKNQIKIREKLSNTVSKTFNKNLFDELFKKEIFLNSNIISSFISIKSEIDTRDLKNYILKQNKILCLPVIWKKNEHLIFRKFTNDVDLTDGFMNTKEPIINNEVLTPDILFVPCLAFDNYGFRLGYGGGYYDRTFSFLKKNNKNFISIGYAFDDQKVDFVPKDKFDIKLDYVITEKKIYEFV